MTFVRGCIKIIRGWQGLEKGQSIVIFLSAEGDCILFLCNIVNSYRNSLIKNTTFTCCMAHKGTLCQMQRTFPSLYQGLMTPTLVALIRSSIKILSCTSLPLLYYFDMLWGSFFANNFCTVPQFCSNNPHFFLIIQLVII